MTGLCLGLATIVQLALPVPHFTLAWNHSVEKIRWEEDYQVAGNQILALAARVRGNGAGMEIPDGAVWRAGAWEYRPQLPPLAKLTLTRSTFTSDYQLCWDGNCRTLTELLGPAPDGTVVTVFACPVDTPARQHASDHPLTRPATGPGG